MIKWMIVWAVVTSNEHAVLHTFGAEPTFNTIQECETQLMSWSHENSTVKRIKGKIVLVMPMNKQKNKIGNCVQVNLSIS